MGWVLPSIIETKRRPSRSAFVARTSKKPDSAGRAASVAGSMPDMWLFIATGSRCRMEMRAASLPKTRPCAPSGVKSSGSVMFSASNPFCSTDVSLAAACSSHSNPRQVPQTG